MTSPEDQEKIANLSERVESLERRTAMADQRLEAIEMEKEAMARVVAEIRSQLPPRPETGTEIL